MSAIYNRNEPQQLWAIKVWWNGYGEGVAACRKCTPSERDREETYETLNAPVWSRVKLGCKTRSFVDTVQKRTGLRRTSFSTSSQFFREEISLQERTCSNFLLKNSVTKIKFSLILEDFNLAFHSVIAKRKQIPSKSVITLCSPEHRKVVMFTGTPKNVFSETPDSGHVLQNNGELSHWPNNGKLSPEKHDHVYDYHAGGSAEISMVVAPPVIYISLPLRLFKSDRSGTPSVQGLRFWRSFDERLGCDCKLWIPRPKGQAFGDLLCI